MTSSDDDHGSERTRVSVPTARAIVDCAVYRDGARVPGRFTHTEALARVRAGASGHEFCWVGLHDPDRAQLADVAAAFGLHPLAVEDAESDEQRPKLERYDDTLVLALRTVAYVEHELHTVSEIVATGQIMVFAGPDFVVAVRRGSHSQLTTLRGELEADPGRLALGPGAVLHAIADHVVDSYLDVADAVQNDVDAMEEDVFTPRSRIEIAAIYLLKREIVELRRAVLPLGTPLVLLTKPETPLPKEVRRYFRDVADHHSTVADRITDFDDALSSLVTASLAKITVQQNTDMRKITALVAIAAVPTMIAGIYGMNFEHMPELSQPWGYPVALIVMITACTALFAAFRRNGWL
ncbi:magnesium and cobalt transport protein CorA [Nocardia sp. NPDC050697]|uniref:magnesium and cobalt transport protein CorA n=1 Tax=Nocardia sp. NPDC050697 TaxID=3155158 RepID=UPI0033C88E5F